MKIRQIFLSIGVMLILNSCTLLYIPNTVNTPLLSNKNEFQASVYTGTSGFDAQTAFAVTDNVGIMLNGSFANRTSDSTSNFHKHKFVELGVGYYTKINDGNGRFEVFGGGGLGDVQGKYSIWSSTYSASVSTTRFFIQPTVGATSDVFDGSFSTRFVMVNLHNDVNSINGMFIEPVLTGKVGYKNLKGVMQVGVSLPLLEYGGIPFDYQPLLISFGLNLNLGKHSN